MDDWTWWKCENGHEWFDDMGPPCPECDSFVAEDMGVDYVASNPVLVYFPDWVDCGEVYGEEGDELAYYWD